MPLREAPSLPASPTPAHAFAGALFEELARSGVRHVCVSPGSRSTPLAVATAQQPGLRCWTHIDERSAAFFALGLAKAAGRPVVAYGSGGASETVIPLDDEAGRAPTGVFFRPQTPAALADAVRQLEARADGLGKVGVGAQQHGFATKLSIANDRVRPGHGLAEVLSQGGCVDLGNQIGKQASLQNPVDQVRVR